jgi:hypothetical protein
MSKEILRKQILKQLLRFAQKKIHANSECLDQPSDAMQTCNIVKAETIGAGAILIARL